MSILGGREAFPRNDDPPEEFYDEDLEPVEVPVERPNPLQALLQAARVRIAEASEEKNLKKKLAKGTALKDLVRLNELVQKREWEAVAWVARVEEATCVHCGAHHSNFLGWFTKSQHRTDPSATRLQRGRRGIGLLHITEVEQREPTEHCGQCVDAWIKRRTALIVAGPLKKQA